MARAPSAARWTVCFLFAAGFHAAGAAALMARWSEPVEPMAGGAVVMVELAPIAATPTPVPVALPPAPKQADSDGEKQPVEEVVEEKIEPVPEPVEEVEEIEEKPPEPVQTAAIVQEPDPVPAIDPELLVMPKPKPPEPRKKPKKKKQKQASIASAPSASDHRARRQTAPSVGPSPSPAAVSSWRARLAAQLERAKRYPPSARAGGDQGTAQLSFTIDRSGGVHRARITRSSGSAILDRETLALIARAQPLPPPPPNLGSSIAITVPIRYSLR